MTAPIFTVNYLLQVRKKMRRMKAEEAGPIITKFIKQALVRKMQCAFFSSHDYHVACPYNPAVSVSNHTLLQPTITFSSGQEMATLLKNVQKNIHTAPEHVPCMEGMCKLNLLPVSLYSKKEQVFIVRLMNQTNFHMCMVF